MSGLVLYLDIQRAAEATSMSPRWIRQQIKDGLPALDTGGKLLVSVDDIKAWMESRFKPKPVDLSAAFEMAEQLAGRVRGRKSR